MIGDPNHNEPDYAYRIEKFLGGIKRWVLNAIPPGDCLTAILKNDLKEAFARADDNTAREMKQIVMYLYNEAPSICWGSSKQFDRWRALGGMVGIEKRRAEQEAINTPVHNPVDNSEKDTIG